jgi:hypothetical protein
MATGAILGTYSMGLFNFCNDMTVSSGGDLYVTDSFQSMIYRLPAGGNTMELWFSDSAYAPSPNSFGFNGITMGADQASLLVGRMDTGELLSIAIEMDGSAGPVTPQAIDTAIMYGGIDGLDWVNGQLYAVRDYQLVRLTSSGAGWTSSTVDASLDSPTTFAVDGNGAFWLVESQFSKLFDGDDSTNGVAPFRVVRIQP